MNIIPFGEDNIDCLCLEEKLNILCSCNPINKIIETINCKKKTNHNILLKSIDSDVVNIYDGNKITKINTDIALYLLIEANIINIKEIIDELKEYLNDSFIIDIQKYLDGNCNVNPDLRNEQCDFESILKHGITIIELKNLIKEKN